MGLETHTLESTLQELHQCLSKANERLSSPEIQEQLSDSLHNDQLAHSQRLSHTASAVVNLLTRIQQKLDQNSLILADHFFSYLPSQCLVAANKWGVADTLGDSQKDVHVLSQICHVEPTKLRRILRILYNRGIFAYEPETGLYRNNSRSKLLLKHHWTQWHTWIDVYGGLFCDASRAIPLSLDDKSHRTPMQIAMQTDEDIYSFLESSGWSSKVQTAMAAGAVAQAPNILADYPWSELAGTTFLDVGGGVGGLVAAVLREHPEISAGIFDTEPVIKQARNNFHSEKGTYADVGGRVKGEDLIAGDFFQSVPTFEVYTIKWTLHNWADPQAELILRNIRRAIRSSPRSRLIILEAMLEDERSGHLSQYADMIMLLSFKDGQERSLQEWQNLSSRTGWAIRNIHPIFNAWVKAIELVPAETSTTFEAPQSERPKIDENGGTVPSNMDVSFTVQSDMRFLAAWNRSEKGNPFIRSSPDEGFERTNLAWETHKVSICDARERVHEFNFDQHGFAFYKDIETLQPTTIQAIRSSDENKVKELYYPYVKRLIADKTGATDVHIFDHTVRRRYPERDKHLNTDGQEQPATIVHCDAGELGARRRLLEALGGEADVEAALGRRVQLINIWKPLNGPVQDWPLGLMDFRSSSIEDVYNIDLWKRQYEDHRQSVTFTHTDEQQWWYLSNHDTDEVTFIKIWDSKQHNTAYYCAHCAFEHPETPELAPPRESVEVRCVVVY